MACTTTSVASAGLMAVLAGAESTARKKRMSFRRGQRLVDPGLPGSGTQHDVGKRAFDVHGQSVASIIARLKSLDLLSLSARQGFVKHNKGEFKTSALSIAVDASEKVRLTLLKML
jgi:hypothetical protein